LSAAYGPDYVKRNASNACRHRIGALACAIGSGHYFKVSLNAESVNP